MDRKRKERELSRLTIPVSVKVQREGEMRPNLTGDWRQTVRLSDQTKDNNFLGF